jgi:putative transposase
MLTSLLSSTKHKAVSHPSVERRKCELIDRRRFRSQAEARMAVFTFIEGWYNPRRRHSALDYLSPVDYEWRTQTETQIASP